MKNSIFKSFRFEIVLYSLLSLIYTILTEAGLYIGFRVVRDVFRSARNTEAEGRLAENAARGLEDFLKKESVQTPLPNMGELGSGSNMIINPFRREGFFLFVGLTVIIGIALFMLYFLLLTKKFARYLDEIARGIQEVSLGNFEARIEIKNKDEFSYIAGEINNMALDIKQLMENERKSEKARNDLITNVAHDLRTPLTSIIGYLDLVRMQKYADEATRDKYIEIAFERSKWLQKLIEDLFSYTKYNSGEASLNLGDVDMVKFMEQVVDEFYPSIEEAGLEYSFISRRSRAVVFADGDLLARAFSNLMSNAVKYGKDGKRIQIVLERGSQGEVRISILNFGTVIPRRELDNIFERFYRVEGSRSGETGGTGLGLAITKKIIAMHGGMISVKSDFGGTVFEVALPLKREGEVLNEKKNTVEEA